MNNQNSKIMTVLKSEELQSKLETLLHEKKNEFFQNISTVLTQETKLQECTPKSLIGAVVTATALSLPVNNNLGFVYIIPYNDRKTNQKVAQLQFGYKAFIQLALRSGQFQSIETKPVYDGQLIEDNSFLGFSFNWKNKKSDKIIGYAAYFKLLNGFEKILYMSVEEIKKHASTYSDTYKKGYGVWVENFDSMAQKTVLKLLLSKYAPLSVEMQKAALADQAVVEDVVEEKFYYVDNQEKKQSVEKKVKNKELQRIYDFVENENDPEKLEKVKDEIYKIGDKDLIQKFEEKTKKQTKKEVKKEKTTKNKSEKKEENFLVDADEIEKTLTDEDIENLLS